MITVLNAGVYSSIQDLGRFGYADIGVPNSGVMDTYAAKIGNHLLQNPLENSVIEITFGGCKFKFEKALHICLTGADFSATLNQKPIEMYSVIKVDAGDILSFGKKKFGVRTYLCVQGQIASEFILKSHSFYKGITNNYILKKGDKVKVSLISKEKTSTFSKIKIDTNYFNTIVIECFKGPEFELLSETEKEQLTKNKFTISNDNNRVGYRLEEIVENNLKSILTSGVLPGTVQLTPSGKLIVLMRDCQVTGGYPRILQLTEKSINTLAQKTTKDKIQFVLK